MPGDDQIGHFASTSPTRSPRPRARLTAARLRITTRDGWERGMPASIDVSCGLARTSTGVRARRLKHIPVTPRSGQRSISSLVRLSGTPTLAPGPRYGLVLDSSTYRPLTASAHGGDAADAFDVVSRPSRVRLSVPFPSQVASATPPERSGADGPLGYQRYAAHG